MKKKIVVVVVVYGTKARKGEEREKNERTKKETRSHFFIPEIRAYSLRPIFIESNWIKSLK